MSTEHPYQVLAFYHFCTIENPVQEVKKHKIFFSERDITSRIYISKDGINGQMSASNQAADEYMQWMLNRPEFSDVHFKIHHWHEHAFPRKTVKYKEKLVAYDERIDLQNRGEYLTPSEWRQTLESDEDKIVLDIRNDYEWKLGHFEGADLPQCATFRQFDEYAKELKTRTDQKKTKVLMYCTGGIRCELYSSVLKEHGFVNVFQLKGGVINYGLEEGSKYWQGKLFVFDDRLSVPISDEETPVIGECHHCKAKTESYYNCANMECNTLFLCCEACLKQHKGCCQASCQEADRVRPYHEQNPHKPFRKWYNYYDSKGTKPAACSL